MNKKFEYDTIFSKWHELKDKINEKAKYGWEVVSSHCIDNLYIQVIIKKEK